MNPFWNRKGLPWTKTCKEISEKLCTRFLVNLRTCVGFLLKEGFNIFPKIFAYELIVMYCITMATAI